MPIEPIHPVHELILPEPIPALANVFRVREAGTETLPFIGLDRNERVSPFPGWFMEKLRAALTSETLNRYPPARPAPPPSLRIPASARREYSAHARIRRRAEISLPSLRAAVR